MNIKPMNNRVVVEITKKEEQTKSGLYIPESANKMGDNVGTVIAVGPGVFSQNGTLIPMRVQVGDKICFNIRSLQKEQITPSESFFHITESEIIAVIE